MKSLLENAIIDIIDKYSYFFLNKFNVCGVGLGYKEIKGFITEELSISVFVKEKKLLKDLNKYDIIPKCFLGIKTDVFEVGEFKVKGSGNINPPIIPSRGKNLKIKRRPIEPGYSIGCMEDSAGTLGAIVFDNNDNTPYILSCHHVLVPDDKNQKNKGIVQPGISDGGCYVDNIIGTLDRVIELYYEDKVNKEKPKNFTDCAIARINDGIEFDTNIWKIGKVQGVSEVTLGERVKKVGKTTGYTEATVLKTNANISTQMEEGVYCNFKDLIVTSHLADPGDSGSLVLDRNNRAIGILLSGTKRSDYISPIEPILKYFNIHF